jgi:hypothetical protein
MKQTFEITHASRKILLQFLENYSLSQLNTIPEGFTNNLIWNIGHIVVVQQMLVYKLSGLPMMVSEEIIDKYKRGTTPEAHVTQDEYEAIKSLVLKTIHQTENDFNDNIFKNYLEFTTMTGIVLKNATDAMAFNCYHEAIHTGIMMGIKKFI